MLRGIKWEMVLATLVLLALAIWLTISLLSECMQTNSFLFCWVALS
jgi:hypothetical protein